MVDKRSVFGWAMYDWANSAYVLTIATAVLPAYFAGVVVPEGGVSLLGTKVAASALWGVSVSVAAFLVFLVAPMLGAVADRSHSKKRFLRIFCFGGAFSAFFLSFCGAGDVVFTLALFCAAHFCFACGNVFYDAFLPEISPPEMMDRISGKGYAYGYIGGGLQFLCCLLLISFHEAAGISIELASRISMGSAAVWWAGFALVAFARLSEKGDDGEALALSACLRIGLERIRASFGRLFGGGVISMFLLAYLFYNDGVQTVIAMATIYGKEELGLPVSVLMVTLLVIQFVAFFGALAFSRLAEALSTKAALLAALTVWTGVVVYAYFIDTPTEYFILGGFVGLVLGGSQALSRSLFARLVPPGQNALYFGYFSVVTKFSAIGGPLVFAVVRQFSGTARDAILAILVFFAVGMTLLSRVKVE